MSDCVSKTVHHCLIENLRIYYRKFTKFSNMQNLSMTYNRNKGHSVLVRSRVIIGPTCARIYTNLSQYHRYSNTANIIYGKYYIEITPVIKSDLISFKLYIIKCCYCFIISAVNTQYVEIQCQLDATEVIIADVIICSTCFGHHYAHHQELKSIIQWLLPGDGHSGARNMLSKQ